MEGKGEDGEVRGEGKGGTEAAKLGTRRKLLETLSRLRAAMDDATALDDPTMFDEAIVTVPPTPTEPAAALADAADADAPATTAAAAPAIAPTAAPRHPAMCGAVLVVAKGLPPVQLPESTPAEAVVARAMLLAAHHSLAGGGAVAVACCLLHACTGMLSSVGAHRAHGRAARRQGAAARTGDGRETPRRAPRRTAFESRREAH